MTSLQLWPKWNDTKNSNDDNKEKESCIWNGCYDSSEESGDVNVNVNAEEIYY